MLYCVWLLYILARELGHKDFKSELLQIHLGKLPHEPLSDGPNNETQSVFFEVKEQNLVVQEATAHL